MSLARRLGGAVERGFTSILKRRDRLPRFVNRAIDDVAKNPDGFLGRVAALLLGSGRGQVPPATEVPDTPIRVYVGPTNYAGQGHAWARALESTDAATGARNMAVALPGGFSFPADSIVPVSVYNRSEQWQRAELTAVEKFTHVLFEAERPLFGGLFGRDVAREVAALQERRLSCAFMCHGTDIRSPRVHRELTRWSPYDDDPAQTRMLQADADANLALLRQVPLPVFVSTPDLLIDVPWASWCPVVVVDRERWAASAHELLTRERPVVVHIPSMSSMKGTQLIEPVLKSLDERGVIEYRTISGVPASEMPRHIGAADIVLDQFRLGSYGVAACEGMAAGRAVVGFVLPQVRQSVLDRVGLELPIIDADPETLESVIQGLVDAPDRVRKAALAGEAFVASVHSGAASATALREGWIDQA